VCPAKAAAPEAGVLSGKGKAVTRRLYGRMRHGPFHAN
jgi:hypothetical protein